MTTTSLMSADDLWNLPTDHMRHELVRGELRTMAPSGFNHSSVAMNLGGPLHGFAKTKGLGIVVGSDAGFVLSRSPDTVRVPDIGFVRADRVPAGPRTVKFWEGAPDLAVEVLSPSDTAVEVEEKVDEYLAAGSALVWIFNPKRKTVTIYRPGQQPTRLTEADEITGEDVVPGFKMRIGDIFA